MIKVQINIKKKIKEYFEQLKFNNHIFEYCDSSKICKKFKT